MLEESIWFYKFTEITFSDVIEYFNFSYICNMVLEKYLKSIQP